MENILRQYIRVLLSETPKILGEPDFPDDDDTSSQDPEEASGSAAVAGVVTPLGTDSSYPNDSKRRSPAAAAGSAFGGAKLYKNRR
jgi:hypothetical protein